MSNWQVVFLSSAATMLVLAIALAVRLPPRTPESKSTYSALLASIGGLALKSSVLQRRVIYQCFLYAAFSVFWTTIPMRLMAPPLHYSRSRVALFALLGGGGGILAAPVGGRLADRGWTAAPAPAR